ncbi:MAG: type transport system ATP-binding protein [Solirubrobacteraceae bacterium]|nr:type transport system ATP-binding protein [Solirubrobacteraceae bacterium]
MTTTLPARPSIIVDGVSKTFRIPREPAFTIKERVLHPLRHREFEELRALANVSFEIAEGEFFGIAGRNGSGKSTLMKCIAGIYRSDGGSVRVRGRVGSFIELGVGFNPDLTARENVVINAVMLGLSPADARRRFAATIEFAELEDFVDLKLKNYSSGMQVRLAFAVLVQLEADILLIDEVLAVGDAAFQQKCIDTLNRMHAAGVTIVLVTHDTGAIEQFCDRAALFEEGALVELGDPARVSHLYTQLNFDRARALASIDKPRYGNGAVQVVEAWFADADGHRAEMLEQLRPCSFHARIQVRRDVPAASLGASFTDAQNRNVFTTSTTWMNQRTGPLAAGEELELTIRFENRLAPGRYFATPIIASESDAELMDLREHFVTVLVTGSGRSGGMVDLQHEIDFARVDRAAIPSGAKDADGDA